MENAFLEIFFRMYRKEYSIGPKHILDVSGLKGNGTGAKMELDEPRGDRVCYIFAGVLICATSHEKLDLAQGIINSHYDELMKKLDKYEQDKQKRLEMREKRKTSSESFRTRGNKSKIERKYRYFRTPVHLRSISEKGENSKRIAQYFYLLFYEDKFVPQADER